MKTNKTIYFAFINFSDDPEMIPPYTQYKKLEAYCQNLGEEMFCWVEASSEFTPETAQSINYVLREHCQLKDAEITMLVSDIEVLGSDIAVIREALIHLRDIYRINIVSADRKIKSIFITSCRRKQDAVDWYFSAVQSVGKNRCSMYIAFTMRTSSAMMF